jgi:two-component system CheB/CheR fusion protein
LLLETGEAGQILRASPGSESYLGLSEDLVLHRPLAELCIPADQDLLNSWLTHLTAGASPPVEIRCMGRDGKLRRLSLEGTCVAGSQPPRLLLAAADITDSHAEYDRLRRHSRTDALTGLASRNELVSALGTQIHRARRDSTSFALLWLDLDGFKDINDRYGHPAGDSALAEVAERIRSSMRGDVVVARTGGDEFALMVHDTLQIQQLDFLADRLLHALRSPLDVGTATCHVTGSVGIAMFPEDSATVDGLLQAADTAMYAAKRQGGDQFRFHVTGMHAETEERARLRQELADSIRTHAFTLHYQPIYNLAEGRVCAAEALLRRVLDDGTIQSAGAFISVAEYSGQIRAMGRQMITTLVRDAAESLPPELPISINLSPAELNDPTLVTYIRQSGMIDLLPRLVIEVTENILLEPRSTGMQTLSLLRSMGAEVALDDYGTGFSNMQTLEQLQPQLLKVDGSFTTLAARGDERGRAFIAAARTLAQSLGSAVLSEGVETQGHLEIVKELGIPLGQGYHLGLVKPPEDLAALVLEQGQADLPSTGQS